MLQIGLTGGIGSGKSLVAEIFSVLGIPVFNADTEARRLMENDEVLMAAIKAKFGSSSYEGNVLNRNYLSGIVFNNPLKLEQLNALVHPAVIRHYKNWVQNKTSAYTIKEAAIMFESGTAGGLNYIIGVFAPLPLRIKRIMQRDSISKDEVLKRMDRQINESIKMKLCNFVVTNDEQQLLIPQVLQIHEQLTNKA